MEQIERANQQRRLQVKKYSFSMFILCALIFIQGCASKPRMAVYVTGDDDIEPNEIKALNAEILGILVNSRKYQPVERSDAFLGEIAKEHNKQRTGAVDEEQISKLGKQYGVQYVCVAEVSKVHDSKQISARIIDVETAVILAMNNIDSNLDNLAEFKDVSNRLINPMLKLSISSKSSNNVENIVAKEEDNLKIKTEDKADESKIQEPAGKTLYWGGSNSDVGQVIFEKIEPAGVKKEKCSGNGMVIKVNDVSCKEQSTCSHLGVLSKMPSCKEEAEFTCSYLPKLTITNCEGKILYLTETSVNFQTYPQASETAAREELIKELRSADFSSWISALKSYKYE
jgi:hypothetical protein